MPLAAQKAHFSKNVLSKKSLALRALAKNNQIVSLSKIAEMGLISTLAPRQKPLRSEASEHIRGCQGTKRQGHPTATVRPGGRRALR